MHKLFDFGLVPLIPDAASLYFRKNGDTISFDTYFNSVPVRKLRRYTSVTALIFRVKSNFAVKAEIAAAGTGYEEILFSAETDGGSSSDYNIKISDISDSAEIIYLRISGCMPQEISVFAEGETVSVTPAVVICTYHRRAQLESNVNYLVSQLHKSDCKIFIVDNASEIPYDFFDSDNVTVIHNENTGGSGGFGRGMKAAADEGGFSHIILMDDDVITDFTAIQKLSGFLAFLKEEYRSLSVSGSMLYSDNPLIQFEAGGYFSDTGLQRGYGYDFNLSQPENIIENEKDKDINYGAWWFMCIPAGYVYSGNYPAPFFIKYDDVEYSLRCRLDIITLNGVGVWHDSFSGKYNAVQEYFNARNYLFLLKWHFPAVNPFRTALKLLIEKLCRQQYNIAEAVLLGYEDFLKGETYLEQIDYSTKLSQLSALNNIHIGDDELMQKYGIAFDEENYIKSSSRVFRRYMQPFLYGQLVPGFLCRRLTVTDVLSDRKEHYFRAGRVLHYDRTLKQGYVTEKSLLKFVRSIFKLILIKIRY